MPVSVPNPIAALPTPGRIGPPVRVRWRRRGQRMSTVLCAGALLTLVVVSTLVCAIDMHANSVATHQGRQAFELLQDRLQFPNTILSVVGVVAALVLLVSASAISTPEA